MRKRIYMYVIICASLLALPQSIHGMEPMVIQENPLLGSKAPSFSLSDLNSRSYKLEEIRQGKKTILFFWATWCPHCRTQIIDIYNNVNQFKSKGVQVVLVDSGETEDQVRSYLRKNGVDMNVYLDIYGVVAEQYKIIGFPTFVYINEEGVITSVQHELLSDYIKYF